MHIQFSFVTHFLTRFFRGIFSNLFFALYLFLFFFHWFPTITKAFLLSVLTPCTLSVPCLRSVLRVILRSESSIKAKLLSIFFLFRYEMPRLDVMEKEERQWGGHLNSIQSWSMVDRGCWSAAKLNEKTSWVASARPAWVPTITGNFRPPLNDPLTVTKRGYLLLFQKPLASLLRALSRWAILFLRV